MGRNDVRSAECCHRRKMLVATRRAAKLHGRRAARTLPPEVFALFGNRTRSYDHGQPLRTTVLHPRVRTVPLTGFVRDYHTMMTPKSPLICIESCMPVYDKPTHNVLKLTMTDKNEVCLELTPAQIDPFKTERYAFTTFPERYSYLHVTKRYTHGVNQVAKLLHYHTASFQIKHYQ